MPWFSYQDVRREQREQLIPRARRSKVCLAALGALCAAPVLFFHWLPTPALHRAHAGASLKLYDAKRSESDGSDGEEEPHLHLGWQKGCAPLVNGTQDTVPYETGKACWSGCTDALADAVLGSFVGTWHSKLMSSTSLGAVLSRFSSGFHALLQWYCYVWLVAMVAALCNLASLFSFQQQSLDRQKIRELAHAADKAVKQKAETITFVQDEVPLELCGGGDLPECAYGVSIGPESFDAVAKFLRGLGGVAPLPRPLAGPGASAGAVEGAEADQEASEVFTFVFCRASWGERMRLFRLCSRALMLMFYVALHCWFCTVLQMSLLASSWVSDQEALLQKHVWASPWVEYLLRARELLHLEGLPFEVPTHILLILVLFTCVGLARVTFDGILAVVQKLEICSRRFFLSSVLMDFVKDGLSTSSAMARLTSLVLFIINVLCIGVSGHTWAYLGIPGLIRVLLPDCNPYNPLKLIPKTQNPYPRYGH